MTQEELDTYEKGMRLLFQRYLNDIENHNTESIIYQVFLNYQSENYLSSTNSKRMVIDFIAGMTDELFLKEIEITKNSCKKMKKVL